ncbi:MAG: hypothetical protein HC876_07970 [Chloroflexaceae bacterium]|nr:hypothetical protein [Chloroflexaceae bacterium]
MLYPVAEQVAALREGAVGTIVYLTLEIPHREAHGRLDYLPEQYTYLLAAHQSHATGTVVAALQLRFAVLNVAAIHEEMGTFTIALPQPTRRKCFCAPGVPA